MDYKVSILLSGVIAVLIVLGGLLFQWLEQKTQDPTIFNITVPLSPDLVYNHQSVFKVDGIGGRNLTVIADSIWQAFDAYDTSNNWNITVTIDRQLVGTNASSNYTLEAVLIMQPINPWTFYNSLFFAESLIVTVGFGQIAPVTRAGRLIACLYSIVGIPVVGVWMGGIGELILQAAKKIRNKLAVDKNQRRNVMIAQVMVIFLVGNAIFILLPSWLFAVMENWDYMDGFYFSVLTLLVVGLGDLVVGTSDYSPGWYRVLINFWLMFGLGWLSMIISIVLDLLKARATQVAKQVEKVATRTEKVIVDQFFKQTLKGLVLRKKKTINAADFNNTSYHEISEAEGGETQPSTISASSVGGTSAVQIVVTAPEKGDEIDPKNFGRKYSMNEMVRLARNTSFSFKLTSRRVSEQQCHLEIVNVGSPKKNSLVSVFSRFNSHEPAPSQPFDKGSRLATISTPNSPVKSTLETYHSYEPTSIRSHAYQKHQQQTSSNGSVIDQPRHRHCHHNRVTFGSITTENATSGDFVVMNKVGIAECLQLGDNLVFVRERSKSV